MSTGDGFGTRLTLHPPRGDLDKSTRVVSAFPTWAQWKAYNDTFGLPQPAPEVSVMALRGKVLEALRLISTGMHGRRNAVSEGSAWHEFKYMNQDYCTARAKLDALIKTLEGEQPGLCTQLHKIALDPPA